MTTDIFKGIIIDSVKGLGPSRFDAIENSLSNTYPEILEKTTDADFIFTSCLMDLIGNTCNLGDPSTPENSNLVRGKMSDSGFEMAPIYENGPIGFSKTLMAGVNFFIKQSQLKGGVNLTSSYLKAQQQVETTQFLSLH